MKHIQGYIYRYVYFCLQTIILFDFKKVDTTVRENLQLKYTIIKVCLLKTISRDPFKNN